jgi:hypothetical protein
MKLHFTKYSGGSFSFGINYFTSTNLVVEDYITIDEVPEDAFPLFTDEMLRDNNSVVYQAGEYDLNLSLLDNTKLSHAGKTIREFFSLMARKCIRVIIEVGLNSTNNRVGFVDNTSLDFNNNWDEDSDSQSVSITVYSAEAELIKGMENISYKEFSDVYHNSFEGQNFWMWVQNMCSYFRIGFVLHPLLTAGIFSKCSPLHKMFYNERCSDTFISAFKGFGLLFKVLPSTFNVAQWNYLSLKVFNRKVSIDSLPATTILEAIDHHELRQGVDEKLQYVGIPHVKLTQGQYTEGDNWKGVVSARPGSLSNSREYVEMRFYPAITPFSTQRLWLFLLPTGFPFGIWNLCGEQNFTIVDVDMVEKNVNALAEGYNNVVSVIWTGGDTFTDLSICRAFVKNFEVRLQSIFGGAYILHYSDSGAEEVAKEFIGLETYAYLIASFEKVKELELKSQYNFEILAFQKAKVENENYIVERVYDIDIINKTYKVQLIKTLE